MSAREELRARLELLLEATESLTETLDFEETLRRVPRLVVPRVADTCHVYLAQADSRLVRVAHADVEWEVDRLFDELDPVYDVERDRSVPIVEAFVTGVSFHAASSDSIDAVLARPGEEDAIARLGTRSLMVLPLAAHGRRFGVLAISSREPGRHDDADFALARELARRVANTLDRLVLHRQARDSLAQLRAVLGQLPMGVVIAEPDGRLVMLNEAVERILRRGVPLDERLAAYDLARLDGSGDTPGDEVEWPLVRSLRDGEIVIGERREVERGDGVLRTIEVNAAPVRGEDGTITAAVAIFGDVTERHRAEERLRFLARAGELLAGSLDTESTLRSVAELAVPGFAGYLVVDLLDDDGALHCVAARHSEPARTALVLRLRNDYPPILPTHPVQMALRTGEPVFLPDLQSSIDSMAHDAAHADAIREIANTSGIVVPLVARGRVLGSISLGTLAPRPPFDEADVEVAAELARRASLALDNARLYEQTRQRAHAAEALEFVDDGVFLLDGAGIVRLWNPVAADVFRTDAAAAVGRPIDEIVPDWSSLRHRVPVAAGPGGRGSRAQTLPVEVAGDERWLSISAVRFAGGTVYAFRDLTEERAVEQMKTDFVSTVSHELRTPLAAIYGAALTLRRKDVRLEDEQRGDLLDVIAGEADRLARIVNDILWASRLESGRMSIAIESCDAASLAHQVADVQRPRLPPEIALVVDAPGDLPAVRADPDKLRQVLTNLVDNAVKYSPDGGRVELGVARSGHRIRFRVRDEGLGIPAPEQERIFEKFFRLDPNLTRGVGGTGLGLYISRELVHRMEGRIWVDSAAGRGSSFFVELPIA